MMWKAKTTSESKKPGSKAVGWNLAGSASTDLTRTRGRRALSESQAAQDIPTQLFTTPIRDDPADTPSTLTGGDDPESVSKKRSVPEHTRATFEIAAVRSVLERHTKPCPKCQSKLEFEFPTCTLATGIRTSCSNEFCSFVEVERPAAADAPLDENAGSCLIERNTDCAINVSHVLGFMSCGDGGSEAAKILGLTGLPRPTTVQKRSFPTIEGRTSATIHNLADEVMNKQLEDEVRLVLADKRDEMTGALLFDSWKEKKLQPQQHPEIEASGDIALR